MTQQEAIDAMLTGKNIFLTGEPGAGKTYTLNKFIEYARQLGKRIAITASTGIAASHIDGVTVHSWSGLGIAEQISDEELERMSWKPYIRDKYTRCDILIIDEVSMLHGHYLDMVERACRWVRRNDLPFGGLQVILVGDLFQLPPVSRDGDPEYVHQSEAWLKADLTVCYLTEQHRQGADDKLLTLLRAMRQGDFNDEQKTWLESRKGASDDDSITRLYTHNVDVDAMNRRKLEELNATIKTHQMRHDGDPYRVQAMKRNILAPETFYWAVGAEVMFVANNFDDGYVNGTRGTITGISSDGSPIVKTIDGAEIEVENHTWKAYDDQGQYIVAEVTQYPLRLAWAVTIHKSQGMSLDAAEIDLSKAFTPGMGYVALSRVRSLEGLHLVGLGEAAFAIDKDIREFDKLLKQGRSSR
jgi:ATP-dependent exoDNAse (exonuclease V) alpha subunit